MNMEGGGTHRLAPGQITDDSELAMCLMRGLSDGNGKLNTAHIVKYYGKWCQDGPFDISLPTRTALKVIDPEKPDPVAPRIEAQ